MEQKPGFRFHPTDEELINDYLRNKILGKTWLVEDVINEINVYDHDPKSLPLLSRIKSKDPVYYFFTRTQYANAKKTSRKRSSKSGQWKPTGKVAKIKAKRGKKREIGEKRVLVYYLGKVKTPWVMHEYQMLLHDPDSYVICKIFDKSEVEEEDISIGNNSSEPSQSLVSDSNTLIAMSTLPEVEEENFFSFSANDCLLNPMNEQEYLSPCDGFNQNTSFSDNNNNHPYVQPQTRYDDLYNHLKMAMYEEEDLSPSDVFDPNMWFFDNNNPQEDDEFLGGLKHVNRWQVEYLFSDYNDYMPKKSLSGIIVDYSSDSDSDSDAGSATSFQGTSSPNDSIGSSNRHFPSRGNETLSSTTYYSCKDLQTYAESQLTRRNIPSKQEVKQGLVKTERNGLGFITEEAMERNRKTPRHIYLMNMIIGFTLLVALIGDIISVYN